jgi:hypothetical protein
VATALAIRLSLGSLCVESGSTGDDPACVFGGALEVSLALSCLAEAAAPGLRGLLRGILLDVYAACSSIVPVVEERVAGLSLLLPRGCSVADARREEGEVIVETSCGLAARCRRCGVS